MSEYPDINNLWQNFNQSNGPQPNTNVQQPIQTDNNNQADNEKLNQIQAFTKMASANIHGYQPLDQEIGYGAEGAPFDCKDSNIRLGFIRKVFYLITFMLVITFGFVALVYFTPAIKAFMLKFWWVSIIMGVILFILIYTLGCFRSVARSVPLNYILMFILTACMSYVVGQATLYYDGPAILIAFGITAVVVIALTIYASCTSTDFTNCGALSIVLGVALMIGTIAGLILKNKWFDVGMAVLGTIIFGFYLVIDIQLVIGKNSRGYSTDDYIMASVSIYMDIVNLFIEILKLVGTVRN